MKIIQQFIADDGKSFETEAECATYEAQLPFVKLLGEVEAAANFDAAFAAKIEALAGKLRRERYDRGEQKFRRRVVKAEPITGAAASADIRADEGRASEAEGAAA